MCAKGVKSMFVERNLILKDALKRKSVFLFGPRQCGKSSLVDHELADAHVFDLLSSNTLIRLSSDPGYIERTCADGRIIVIDEIQKLPSLLDEVHRLIERRGFRFLLTGSSARKLRRKGVNLLGGRARVKRLHPFSASELKDLFDLDHAVNFGLLPPVVFSDEPEEELADYIDEYIRQEIIAEGATRNLPAFSRFLEIAALSNGGQIDYAAISRDAQVPRSTVQEYFRILKETLLADEVPSWKRGAKRKTVETSKFYFFDSGVARRLSHRRATVAGTPEYGHLFETWIHHELRCYLDMRTRDGEIAYWRTPAGTEVDFIVGNAAIEAKSTDHIDSHDMKSLRALSEEGQFARRTIVCREPRAASVDGIDILPAGEFVERLWNDELIDVSSL